jgi:hypothetical protein
MTSILVDCGHAVIRIEVADDHAHMEILCPSIHDEDTNRPAESASAYIGAAQARQIIDALGHLKPALKSVGKDQH